MLAHRRLDHVSDAGGQPSATCAAALCRRIKKHGIETVKLASVYVRVVTQKREIPSSYKDTGALCMWWIGVDTQEQRLAGVDTDEKLLACTLVSRPSDEQVMNLSGAHARAKIYSARVGAVCRISSSSRSRLGSLSSIISA